ELEVDPDRKRLLQLPLRPLDFDGALEHFDVHALGHDDRLLPNSRHRSSLSDPNAGLLAYQTLQSTSPPTPAFTALRPVMTPRDAVRMLVPRPARTSGTSSRPK